MSLCLKCSLFPSSSFGVKSINSLSSVFVLNVQTEAIKPDAWRVLIWYIWSQSGIHGVKHSPAAAEQQQQQQHKVIYIPEHWTETDRRDMTYRSFHLPITNKPKMQQQSISTYDIFSSQETSKVFLYISPTLMIVVAWMCKCSRWL